MRYLPLMILAVLLVGLIAGCTTNVPPEDGAVAGESNQASQVASEAEAEVDSTVLDDTDAVEIGEMI